MGNPDVLRRESDRLRDVVFQLRNWSVDGLVPTEEEWNKTRQELESAEFALCADGAICTVEPVRASFDRLRELMRPTSPGALARAAVHVGAVILFVKSDIAAASSDHASPAPT